MTLPLGFSSMRQVIIHYKANAKRRGYDFNLTEEQFKEMTQKDCYYCGAKPNQFFKQKYHNNYRKFNGDFIYNGLDRIDSNKGYTIDNIVPCCSICNYAKHNLTLQEFQDWIEKVYNKMFKEKYDAELGKLLYYEGD